MKSNTPWLALCVAAAACLLYLASELYVTSGALALPLDDSWIHLQFARRIAAGDGLAYNPGQWISGSTAPLWTALLAPGFVALGPLVWAKLLGIACFLAAVHATDRLAAELGLAGGLRRLAAALTAATHWLAWSALSGMEIALFSALSLWGMVLHLRERRDPARLPLALPVLALAALARPEGWLLLALAAFERPVRFETTPSGLAVRVESVPGWWTGAAAAAIVTLPTALFYRVAGGSFLPTTFAVKTAPAADLIPSGRYLGAVIDVLFRSQPVLLLVAGAGVLCLVERLGGERDRGLLPALWPLGMALGYALLAAPEGPVVVGNFGRYYFPLLPVVAVLGALGLERAGRRLGRGVLAAGRRWPVTAVAVAALAAPQLWGLLTGPPRYLQTLANVEDSDVAAARWLAGRLPGEALLAVQDIGAIKYHLPNRIVDLTGIVNPDILPYLHGSGPRDPVYWEERLLAYLEQKRPDYLVVFPRSYPWLTGRAAGFERVRSFAVRDNVTMAGSELAIYSTPWTRHPLREDDSALREDDAAS